MTYKEREQETVRRLRAEWEQRHQAERLMLQETEARATAPIELDDRAQILFELEVLA